MGRQSVLRPVFVPPPPPARGGLVGDVMSALGLEDESVPSGVRPAVTPLMLPDKGLRRGGERPCLGARLGILLVRAVGLFGALSQIGPAPRRDSLERPRGVLGAQQCLYEASQCGKEGVRGREGGREGGGKGAESEERVGQAHLLALSLALSSPTSHPPSRPSLPFSLPPSSLPPPLLLSRSQAREPYS